MDTAQFLVREKHAVPEDFQVYCGFAAWSPGQLQKELERNNWYMASVDSQTILQELLSRPEEKDNIDPFGLDAWRKFAERIGRVNNTNTAAERFDDCMLLEWIRTHLLAEGNEEEVLSLPPTRPPGTILRASGPFLLDNQEFHKSLLLVLEDTPAATIGVLLNLPGAENITGDDNATIPIRYGGKFGIQGKLEKPITWYHCDESLREARVGNPVGLSQSAIWTCTREDAETAIEMGLADLDDFIVTKGATVLKKTNDVASLKALEKFQVIPRSAVPHIWEALLSQEGITTDTLDEYIDISDSIWTVSGEHGEDSRNDEDDCAERDLNRVAWKSWIGVFLLGDPTLRGS